MIDGGTDFYGSNPNELRRELKKSMEAFQAYKEQDIMPSRHFQASSIFAFSLN
jgi:hypothetical protein